MEGPLLSEGGAGGPQAPESPLSGQFAALIDTAGCERGLLFPQPCWLWEPVLAGGPQIGKAEYAD